MDLPPRNNPIVSLPAFPQSLSSSSDVYVLYRNVRHIGAAAATSAEWLTAFLVQEITPIAVTSIGWKYYIVFACVCIVSIPIVYFYFPETSGKSLEEIDMIFSSGSLHHPGSLRSMDEKVISDEKYKEEEEDKPTAENVEVL